MQLIRESRTSLEDKTERKTILLVDDERDLLNLLAQALEFRGYEVLAASTPATALMIARTHSKPIHILVSDISLPGMSGIDLAFQVSSLHPSAKTLMISGELLPAAPRTNVHFLSKPFTIEELTSQIGRILP